MMWCAMMCLSTICFDVLECAVVMHGVLAACILMSVVVLVVLFFCNFL